MIKFLSLMLIAAAFAFGGKAYASHKESKTKIIGEVIILINALESRLRYSNAPLNDILRDIDSCSMLGFVKECISKTENGATFHCAWAESISESRKLWLLLGESAQTLIDFGTGLGVTDTQGQISNCEYYKEVFSSELAVREAESRKSSKVFPQLGLLAGVFTLIFLL